MAEIGQILVLVVAGGFVVGLGSAVSFVIGKFVGNGLKTCLVSYFTVLGVARDHAVMAAVAVELIAAVGSVAIVSALVFSTGLFAGDGRDTYSLFGVYRLLLAVGSVAVVASMVAGVVDGTLSSERADDLPGSVVE